VDADGNLIVALDKNLAADSLTLNGKDGKDGISLTGAAGKAGVDGKDGVTRIIYTDPTTGEEQQVATLNDGMKFGGNTGDVIAKKLNEQLDITGDLAADAEATGANLRVDSKDGKLNLVMSKDLTDLNSVTVGDTVINGDSVTTTNLTVTGETKLGDSFTVNNGGATYTGPITNGDHITNKTYVDGKTASAKTEVTEGKNISVSSVTGADGQTIYTVATEDEVDFTKVTVGDTSITTDGLEIAGGPSITKDGINAGGKKVTDVADGEISENSKDAVNGSQLYALGNNVTELFGGNATYVNNQISWNNIGGTGQSNIDDAIKYVNDQAANANQGWIVATDSGASAASTVKPGDTVNVKGDSASGVTVSNNGNDITVGLSDQIKVGSGNNAVSIDGNAGTIEVGDVKIDGSTGTITAGQVTVNGDAGTVNGLTNTTWNPDNITSGQAATEDQLKQVAQNAAQAAAAAKSTVTAGDNITVTSTQNDDGSTNYQVATNKDVTFDSVTAGDVNASKVSVGNVTIDQAGINAGGNKVTNVADGAINSTSQDAINGSQLHASNTNIYNYLGGGANYETNTGPTYNVGGGTQHNVGDALDALDQRDNQLDQKITNLGDQLQQSFYTTNKRIDDVEKRAMAGIAAAMSLETAPYVAGKWTYAAAAAHHGGENAVGVTLRKTADNGRWSLTSGIAAASQGDPSFRIGISGVID
ncbi:YadA-like family protein, partial [Acinetobacter sp. YH1901134]|uniref:YadA-like family protein n=1 Tax=Acinetobacter sp. YH1901134 TaxID=2601199 RepID=UPI0015D2B520